MKSGSYDFSKLKANTDYYCEISDGFMGIPTLLINYAEEQWRCFLFSLSSNTTFGIIVTKNNLSVYGNLPSNASFYIYEKQIY